MHMEKKTLREACEEAGVSRRAVQGYEKAGLVTSAGKDDLGRLLYDGDAVSRIKAVRFLQDVGLTVKEAAAFMEASGETQVGVLEQRLADLEKKLDRTNALIRKLERLVEELARHHTEPKENGK